MTFLVPGVSGREENLVPWMVDFTLVPLKAKDKVDTVAELL